MRRGLVGLPDERELAPGYELRVATPNDAAALADLLSKAFEEPWDERRVEQVLLNHPGVPETYVIEHGETLVATASYQVMPEEFPGLGWVHYVGADSVHRGQSLGYIIVHAVLRRCVEEKMTGAMLTTDDPRLPATQTYLKLGFEPDIWHPSHPERWAAVLAQLNPS